MEKILQWVIRTVVLQALDALGKYIPHALEQWKREKEREIAQREAKEKYDLVVSNPEATREDIARALEEYLNARGGK